MNSPDANGHETAAPIVVTGLHRSGTTWVGQMLETTGKVAVLHEPLNIQNGIKGVPCWYPFHPGRALQDGDAPFATHIEGLFEDFFNGRSHYVRSSPKGPPHRRIARAILGNRSERTYRNVFRRGATRLCLKDPFCLFCVPHLVEKYGARIIVLVRHPAALLVSMRRMGWQPHLASLRSQPGLFRRHCAGLPDTILEDTSDELAANAAFWTIAARWSLDLEKAYPQHVKIVLHEDLSHGMDDTLAAMLRHLDLEEALPRARAFVDETTKGSTVVPAKGILHEFKRDGEALTSLWRTALTSAEQARLHDIVKREVDALYGT